MFKQFCFCFSLPKMKYILFFGENAAKYRGLKNVPSNLEYKSDYAVLAGTSFALKPGKKGLSDLQNLIQSG